MGREDISEDWRDAGHVHTREGWLVTEQLRRSGKQAYRPGQLPSYHAATRKTEAAPRMARPQESHAQARRLEPIAGVPSSRRKLRHLDTLETARMRRRADRKTNRYAEPSHGRGPRLGFEGAGRPTLLAGHLERGAASGARVARVCNRSEPVCMFGFSGNAGRRHSNNAAAISRSKPNERSTKHHPKLYSSTPLGLLATTNPDS